MGSTGCHRERGMSDRQFFEQEFPVTLVENGEIVVCASVRSVFYAAVRQRATGEVWAMVVEMHRYRGWENFVYKEMDEGMGPHDADAPAAVLDALTPTEDEYATKWRAKCRARLAAKAARPTVTRGDLVMFGEEIEFTNGRKFDALTFVERSTFIDAGGVRYRVPSWREREHVVVA